VTNLGNDVPRERSCRSDGEALPRYCLRSGAGAQNGFPALVVLGGDKSVGRRARRTRGSSADAARGDDALTLGGWANPHADPERQVDYLGAANFHAEFFLTQVVSHHHAGQVARFVAAAERRGLQLPGIFGVFYYRSANARTLGALNSFLPVPVEGLTREFAEGATPEDVCARTIRTLMDLGARHFYISNLPVARARQTLASVLEKVGVIA
jgi:hypothetical protein